MFRAIHVMSERKQNVERKYQVRQGNEFTRITGEVTDSTTEKDKKRMHITPITKELIFARDYQMREYQKLIYQEEYEALEPLRYD